MTLAPIILFVYNRPTHTQKTLEALSKNDLAEDSHLIIYSDGPKMDVTKDDIENIFKVRNLIRSKKWCGKVQIIERDKNWGLADNIVDGVTSNLREYGKVIVLEDDMVVSPSFLKYMNDALNLYENKEKVMHVSAYWFPVKNTQKLPTTFFLKNATCSGGWATWKRAWDNLITDPALLKRKILEKEGSFNRFTLNQTTGFLKQLNNNISGKKKTWAIKWYASIYLLEGLSLHPNHSLVNNIGFDDSGENSGSSDHFDWVEVADEIKVRPVKIKESRKARIAIKNFYIDKKKLSNFKKFKYKLKSIVAPEIKYLFINRF